MGPIKNLEKIQKGNNDLFVMINTTAVMLI